MIYVGKLGERIKALQFDGLSSVAKIRQTFDVAIDDVYFDQQNKVLELTTEGRETGYEIGDWIVQQEGVKGLGRIVDPIFKDIYSEPKKVFLINGPAGSGKDTVAQILVQTVLGFGKHMAFKTALYKMLATYYNLPLDTVIKLCTDRNTKEKPNKLFTIRGEMSWWKRLFYLVFDLFLPAKVSPRQALIYISEKIIKPKYGNTFFGKALAESILASEDQYIFVSDSGFLEEITPLIKLGMDVKVIRIHRDGYTFDGDSRRYLTDEELSNIGVDVIDIENNGSLGDLEETLTQLALNFIIK